MALEALNQTAGATTTPTSGGLPTFDANYYLAQNPDVATSSFASDPYQHYLQYGQNEGRLGAAPVTQTAQPDYKSQIEQLYQQEFKRPGDPGGMEYWTGQAAAGVPIEQIRAAMQASPEAQALKNTGTTSNIEFDPKNMGVTQQQVTQAPGTFSDAQVAAYIRDNNLTGQNLTNAMGAFNISPEQLQKAQALLASNDPSIAAATQAYNASAATDPSAVLKNKAIYDPTTGTGALVDVGQIYEQVLGRKPDAEGLAFWSNALASGQSIDQIRNAFLQSEEAKTSPDAIITQDYQKYMGRAPDAAGKEYWKSQLAAGKTPEQIAHEIALSDESVKANTTPVKELLEATLGKDIVSKLTPEQLSEYTKTFLDPTRAQQKVPLTQSEFDNDWYLKQNPDVIPVYGSSPDSGWRHYLENGFREGRLGSPTDSNAPKYGTSNDNLKDIYKQIALDPTLGPQLKTSNPYLYEAVTPIQQVAPKDSGRSLYGYFGMYNDVPILNAAAVDSMIDSGYGRDFSHGRGKGSINIGWTSNSYSNKIVRGAGALGVEPQYDYDGNFVGYKGLNEAADMLKIDKSQFKDKQVQDVTKDQYDDTGRLVQKGGEPAFIIDENANWVPVMKTISAQDQLFDAVNKASQGFYLATMDSIEPGAAVEGGSRSFQTVMYQKVGDKLLAISAPQSHGGMQNYDVYNPSHGFLVDSGLIQGATFVGSMALMAMTAGGAAPLASIGGAVTAGAATGTAAAVVGGAVVGAALAAGNIAGSGGTVTGENILPGAVAGGVGAAMGPVLNSSDTMRSAMDSIAKASGGLYTSAQVSNIIGNTLANTLATAARGANGDQILKSFTTSLAANGIGQAAATGITEALKGIEGFSPNTIAKVAKAGQMLSSVAATAALTGKNQDQIMQSIITQLTDPTKLVGNIVNVATTTDKTGVTGGTTTTTPTKVSDADYNGLVDALGSKQLADAWVEGLQTVNPDTKYAPVASTGDTELVGITSTNKYVQNDDGSIFKDSDGNPVLNPYRATSGSETGGGIGRPGSESNPIVKTETDPTTGHKTVTYQTGDQLTTDQNGDVVSEKTPKEVLEAEKAALELAKKSATEAEIFKSIMDSFALNPKAAVAIAKVAAVSKISGSGGTGTTGTGTGSGTTGTGPGKGVTGTTGTGVTVTGTTGVTGVTGTTGTGVTGVTGTGTGVTGVTGTGTGVTGTGTGGGGTGGDGTGTGVTGTGTGGGGTGTGTGGGGTGTGTGGGVASVVSPLVMSAAAAPKIYNPDQYGHIQDLDPGLTQGGDYSLTGLPTMSKAPTTGLPHFASGSSTTTASTAYNPFSTTDSTSGISGSLTPGLTKAQLNYVLTGLPGHADGGEIEGENSGDDFQPQFFSVGGLSSMENTYVKGPGDGTSDSVKAMLANGEFVIPADVVSKLGNGSNDAGADVLDNFLTVIREHAQKHDPKKLPPTSKGPLAYLLEVKKRA